MHERKRRQPRVRAVARWRLCAIPVAAVGVLLCLDTHWHLAAEAATAPVCASDRGESSPTPREEPLPDHGSWEWLFGNQLLTLPVDADGWHRIVGAGVTDRVERHVLGEIIDSYRRELVAAVDAFEEAVVPNGSPWERRLWWQHGATAGPDWARRTLAARIRLADAEVAALERLARDTIAYRRYARIDDCPRKGWGPALLDGGSLDFMEDDDALERAVRAELIMAARRHRLRNHVLSHHGGGSGKLDIRERLGSFFDRHRSLELVDGPPGSCTAARVETVLSLLGPFRERITRLHLEWRDASVRSSSVVCDPRIDPDEAVRAVRGAAYRLDVEHDQLARNVAEIISRGEGGDVAAALWLRHWRSHAFHGTVLAVDRFEDFVAWIEATDAVTEPCARSALAAMVSEHRLWRRKHDETLTAHLLGLLECRASSGDESECDRSRLLAAAEVLDLETERRIADAKRLIRTPELLTTRR